MSDRQKTTETRTIHPRVLAALGERVCVEMLGVARDLRSGVIPSERYDQGTYCGTACCVAGHLMIRLGVMRSGAPRRSDRENVSTRLMQLGDRDSALWRLFSPRPSDPLLAADAIERYVLAGSVYPWRAT
jgi:hypothetical protein